MLVSGFKFARELLQNRRGATAAEFAIVMPVFFTLLLGTLEFGVVLYSYSAMQMAAGTIARRVAVNSLAPNAGSTIVSQLVPAWALPHVTLLVTQSNHADPATNVIRVRVTGRSDQITIVPMLTRMVPWTLVADVSAKQELRYED
jgi:Flp pilus assembly protein TadG